MKTIQLKSSGARPCPRCNAKRLSPLVCPECRAIEKPASDAFALLGLRRSWAIDSGQLEEHYAFLSRLLDPDELSGRGEEEWRVAAEAAEALSAARRLLSDPLERGRYLLSFYAEQENRERSTDSSEFLTQVMEIQRSISQAEAEGDAARLKAARIDAEEKLASALFAVGQSFTRLEQILIEETRAAADALEAAQYWGVVVDEIRGKTRR